MKCECKICQRHREFSKHLTLIKEGDLNETAEFFEKIYGDLNGVELDYQVDEAILNGQWPTADQQMEARGWKRVT